MVTVTLTREQVRALRAVVEDRKVQVAKARKRAGDLDLSDPVLEAAERTVEEIEVSLEWEEHHPVRPPSEDEMEAMCRAAGLDGNPFGRV